MPEISVIVPVYKVEPYLRRCVDSILNQTFQDFELILVDDGSPDNCPAICDEYADRDRRIVVIHQKNAGLSAARNAGIDWVFANSDSEWLSFIDSDDWVHPRFLEVLFQAVTQNHVLLGATGFLSVTKKEKYDEMKSMDAIKQDALLFYAEKYIDGVFAWNKLYGRELFRNIRYPVGMLHEDAFTTYKILYDAKEIAVISEKIYYYFQRDDSIMGGFSLQRLVALQAFDEQIHFFRKKRCLANVNDLKKQRLNAYLGHLYLLQSYPEYRREYSQLRRKYAFYLLKDGRQSGYSIRKTSWYYDVAFPRVMKLVHAIYAIKNG